MKRREEKRNANTNTEQKELKALRITFDYNLLNLTSTMNRKEFPNLLQTYKPTIWIRMDSVCTTIQTK